MTKSISVLEKIHASVKHYLIEANLSQVSKYFFVKLYKRFSSQEVIVEIHFCSFWT